MKILRDFRVHCAMFILVIAFVAGAHHVHMRIKKAKQFGTQTFKYDGFTYTFHESPEARGAFCILKEIERGDYPLMTYKFEPGDVIVDVGAHIGIVSVILAKLNPQATVYSIEACPTNFENLLKNKEVNNVPNLHPFCFAVTKNSGDKHIIYDLKSSKDAGSSGQSSLYTPKAALKYNAKKWEVGSISLDDFFIAHNIKHCKLLKIDCEGAEYDILYNSEKFKQHCVTNMVGEFHINNSLAAQGFSMKELYDYCRDKVKGTMNVVFVHRMLD